jgi:HEAT repeat protein
VTELIDLLSDEDLSVRFEARETLMRLAGGVDHGPSEDATEIERQESLTKWKKWQVLQRMLKTNLDKTQTALVAEFQHKDRDKRYAAVAAARKLRMVVIDSFVAVLNDPDDGVRQEARHALVSLSRGTDFGPSENSDNTRCEEAVKSWTDWWVTEKEKLAKSKFDQAKKLADAGRREPARRRFQEIIQSFPGTKAAKSSKRLMDKL